MTPRLRWLLLSGLWLAAACRAAPAPPPAIPPTSPPDILRIGLSDSAAPVASLVAAAYVPEAGGPSPQFVLASDSVLAADLAAGQFDAILVHVVPAGSPFWFNPVAVDGLIIITHPANPLNTLSTAEIQAIFSGQVSNWQGVGGPDQPIVVLSRDRGAGARALLEQRLLGERRLSVNAQIVAGDAAMLAAVAADPAAIGTSMMGAAEGVQAMAVDGRSATPANTASQAYPLTVPLYFVAGSPAEPTGNLRAFLAWLQSDAGQAVLGQRYGRVR